MAGMSLIGSASGNSIGLSQDMGMGNVGSTGKPADQQVPDSISLAAADTDGDGKLSGMELIQALAQMLQGDKGKGATGNGGKECGGGNGESQGDGEDFMTKLIDKIAQMFVKMLSGGSAVGASGDSGSDTRSANQS